MLDFQQTNIAKQMNNRADQLYKNLSDWLTELDADVLYLNSNSQVFWRVQEIIRNNPEVSKQGNHFLYYMKDWYEAFVSIRIRRLTDRTRNVRSYRKFLEAVGKHNEVVSRARYKKNFVDDYYTEERADGAFDSLVGKGEKCIKARDVNRDIQEFESKAKIIVGFVNTSIAHKQLSGSINLPKHPDVKAAIDSISEIHKKYWRIFRGSALVTTTPTIQYDWEEIFRIPWIDSTSD